MRHHPLLPTIALGLAGLGLSTPAIRADIRWVETTDLMPTASVVELPRTYVIPTTTRLAPASMVIPTTSLTSVYGYYPTTYVPTTYVPTTYVPSTYVPTTYYAPARYAYRTYRPRRVYATTTFVTPTYFVAPATYASGPGLVATSADLCCEMASAGAFAVAPMPQSNGNGNGYAAPRASAEAVERGAAGPLESTVAGSEPGLRLDTNKPLRDDGLNSATGAADPFPAPNGRAALPGGNLGSGVAPGSGREPINSSAVDNPAAVARPPAIGPAAPREPKTSAPASGTTGTTVAPSGDPAKTATPRGNTGFSPARLIPPPTETSPPTATEPDVTPPLPVPAPIDSTPATPKDGELLRRDAMKPVVPPADTRARSTRSILQGTVVSADTRKAEEGVEIVLSDKQSRFVDRRTQTDAFGKFAVTLPDGDWTIKLTMPSGRVLAVGQGQITSSAGRVLDMYGRDLKNLVIQR